IKREVERFRPDYALRRLISVNPCFDVDWPLELRHALSRTTRSGNAGHNLGRLPEERVHNPAIGLRARSLAEAVTVVRFCDSSLELFPQLIDWRVTSGIAARPEEIDERLPLKIRFQRRPVCLLLLHHEILDGALPPVPVLGRDLTENIRGDERGANGEQWNCAIHRKRPPSNLEHCT